MRYLLKILNSFVWRPIKAAKEFEEICRKLQPNRKELKLIKRKVKYKWASYND